MGKFDEIRELFKHGKTVAEIVAAGYKKPSVYKVHKEFKEETPDTSGDDNSGGDSDGDDNTNLDTSQGTDPDPDPEPDPEPGAEHTSGPDTGPDSQDGFSDDERARIKDLFEPESDVAPFRGYSGVDINRDSVSVLPMVNSAAKTGSDGPCGKSKGISTAVALEEGFELIGSITDNDFWVLTGKEKQLIKKLCIVPGLDKYLVKFGLYGCAIVMLQIIFKRIRLQFKKSDEAVRNDSNAIQEVPDSPGTNIRPVDKSSHILSGMVPHEAN